MTSWEKYVTEGIHAQLRKVGQDRYSVEFLNEDGSVRAVRPASPLEVRMWVLLMSSGLAKVPEL